MMNLDQTTIEILDFVKKKEQAAHLRGYEQGVKDTTDTKVYSSGFWAGFSIAIIILALGIFLYKLLA
jgi:hypothetical protein